MNTDSFIVNRKVEDVYKDIANHVERIFDNPNYEAEKPLPTDENKKVIELMKDEWGEKITKEHAGCRPKKLTLT